MNARLITAEEVAQRLGVEMRVLQRLVLGGWLPQPTEDGLFNEAEIDAAIVELRAFEAQGRTSAANAPPPEPDPEPVTDDIECAASFMRPCDLARRWALAESTLSNLRAKGEGIPYVKLPSGAIRYNFADVLAAEQAGWRGFTWEALDRALRDCPSLGPYLRKTLITHARRKIR